MKFRIGDIVKIQDNYCKENSLPEDDVDKGWHGKVGRISAVRSSGVGIAWPYDVEVFIPHSITHRTVCTNVKESELRLLESTVDDLAPNDEVQLVKGWYIDTVVSDKSVDISHPDLHGNIRIARKYVEKVD